MGHFGELRRFLAEVPICPMCDGPCKHEFGPLGPWRFPDRLPRAEPPHASRDPDPPKPVKVNRRGRRMVTGPAEDRMVRGPDEDRAQ